MRPEGDLRLAAEPTDLRWRGGLIMRGLRTLPVEFTAEGADRAGKPSWGAPSDGASGL